MFHNSEARSLGDLLRRSKDRFPEKTAILNPEGKQFVPYSYAQFYDKVFEFARALDAAGLERGDKLAVLSENCMEWALTDWAAQTLGVVVVPIYPTLPPDQTQYIVRDSGAKAVVVHDKALAQKLEGVHGLRLLAIQSDQGIPSVGELAQKSDLSRQAWEAEIDQTAPTDLATLIYTSGTTGNPKGAMLTHEAFTSLIAGVHQDLPIDENDSFLSWLPLSHVYERAAGHFVPVGLGCSIIYSRSLASLAGDLTETRPTILLAVPRFLEAMRGRIIDAIEKQSPIKRRLFWACYKAGLARAQGRFSPFFGLLDRLVGQKIRERTGGRLRFFVSGGSALPKHVADFYSAFGLTILQGFGLTETSGASVINRPDRNDPTTVGEPLPGMELRIAEDGEVLMRGKSVMKGYHNLPEDTAAAIDPEGWFHTGDIGKIEGGKLKITDRKKDLLVLANGKNVAPQPIENKLREGSFIAEAVLFGDNMEFVCGLILPDFERLTKHLEVAGQTKQTPEELAINPEVKKLLKSQIDEVNKTLADFEKVKRFEVLTTPFSIESGELTPSLKVRRKVVKERYADLIQGMKRS